MNSFLPSFFFSEYLYLIVGLLILIKSADILVQGASSIATRFGISPLIIGLTIVAFGTSAPELFVNVLSAIKGQTELALGNVIGSNIANTWLVLGAAALVYPLQAKTSTVYKEVPFSLFVSFVLLFFVYDSFFQTGATNVLMRGESFILLGLFLIFFIYTFLLTRSESYEEKIEEEGVQQELSLTLSVTYVIGGLAFLGMGADMLIGSAKTIAFGFGVSEAIIGLTIIAFGTSLPELVTSIIASLKKQSDIAIGNVVGSNIFNILLVLGLTGSVTPVYVEGLMIFDILIELFAITLLMCFLFFFGKKGLLKRSEGGLFLVLYFGYITYITYSQIL